MVEFVNPYTFDESMREHLVKCENNFHPQRHVKTEGPLWIEICLDPECAMVIAKCEHQIYVEDTDKLAPTKPINTWNANGTVLTCQYCGKDVT